MNIAFVGPGNLRIPPDGWGGVESVIWEYSEQFRELGHRTCIVNRPWQWVAQELIRHHRATPIDWCWVHSEKALIAARAAAKLCGFKVAATAHGPFDPLGIQPRHVRRQYWRLKRSKFHLALTSEQAFAAAVMSKDSRVALQPNATRVERFRFCDRKGNFKAACVGRIDARKRQFLVAELIKGSKAVVDFIGPSDIGPVPIVAPSRYLGEWDRRTLAERLTEYSALVLYSSAEVHPMVVPEAMAAGLSVVLSPQSAANLDTFKPFVHIVERDEDLAKTIEKATAENATHRREIRAYAEANFGLQARVLDIVRHLKIWDSENRASGLDDVQ